MKFMQRHRRTLSLWTLACFLPAGAATPAAAYYNPALGRFMSPDPNGQGLVLAPTLRYPGANPVVTVNMAYTLQFADGMGPYQFVRSNPVTGADPTGLFSLLDNLSYTAIRAEFGVLAFAAAHPAATRFAGGLLAAANLYAFAQYQEIQAIVVAQPEPLGFLSAQAAVVRAAMGDVLSASGSARGLMGAAAESQALAARATQTIQGLARSSSSGLYIMPGGSYSASE